MFGAISSNKENIIVFIAMLKGLRFTFDHEELVGYQQTIYVMFNVLSVFLSSILIIKGFAEHIEQQT